MFRFDQLNQFSECHIPAVGDVVQTPIAVFLFVWDPFPAPFPLPAKGVGKAYNPNWLTYRNSLDPALSQAD